VTDHICSLTATILCCRYARGSRLGPDSDYCDIDDVLMAKTVRGELLGKKNVSSVDSAAVSGSAVQMREIDGDRIQTLPTGRWLHSV